MTYYCAYCNCQISPDANFCPGCGAPTYDSLIKTETVTPETAASDSASGTYSIILEGLGSCSRNYCNDLLEDLLGYTDSEASKLISIMPTQIGRDLNREQALTIAQALSEYGVDVSVTDENGDDVDLGDDDDSLSAGSLFNADGSLIKKALVVLGTLTAANRIRKYSTWKRKNKLFSLFGGNYRRNEPPKHIRRPIHTGTIYQDHRPQNWNQGGPVSNGPINVRPDRRQTNTHQAARPGRDQYSRREPGGPGHSPQGPSGGSRPGGSGPGGHGPGGRR